MSYRRGDVVLVRIDFTDGSGGKWRPAVIVSTNTYNDHSPDILIASITSNLAALPHPGDCILKDWQLAGLIKESLAQTKLATVEASVIGRSLGALSPADLSTLSSGLREALGL